MSSRLIDPIQHFSLFSTRTVHSNVYSHYYLGLLDFTCTVKYTGPTAYNAVLRSTPGTILHFYENIPYVSLNRVQKIHRNKIHVCKDRTRVLSVRA